MAGPRGAWVLTVSLLILIALQIFVQYRINVWNRSIFDALQARDSGAVLFQALIFRGSSPPASYWRSARCLRG